jgi:hypothetical protein
MNFIRFNVFHLFELVRFYIKSDLSNVCLLKVKIIVDFRHFIAQLRYYSNPFSMDAKYYQVFKITINPLNST